MELTSIEVRTDTPSEEPHDFNPFDAFCDGDGTALVSQCEPMLRETIARVVGYRDQATIDDLMQKVWEIVWGKRDQLRERKAYSQWLKVIARRTAINHITRNHRLPQYPLGDDDESLLDPPSREAAPLDQLVIMEKRQQVRDGCMRLREIDREALQLFHGEGRSILEMQEILNVPEGTVKRRLHVARKRLALELSSVS